MSRRRKALNHPYHRIEPGDEEFMEQCPMCEKGYMVITSWPWHQCSYCGIEAKEGEEDGLLWFDT